MNSEKKVNLNNGNLIDIKNLTKKYGKFCAVDNISFSVKKGEMVGFLGLNGAGKSTAMDMITSCTLPTSGTVEIGGYDILKKPEEARKFVGYLPDTPPLYGYMTVDDYLKFVCDLKGVKSKDVNSEVARVISEVGLEEKKNSLNSTLSKGYRQRVGLAQALIGDPDLLILDEPTSGLDPSQVVHVRNLFKQLSRNHTIILSTHILSEVEQVCDRIIIINRGRIIANDIRQNLSSEGNKMYSVRVVCKNPDDILPAVKVADVNFQVKNLVKMSGDVVEFSLEIPEDVQENEIYLKISKALIASDISILQFKNVSQSIEQIFLSLVENDNAQSAEIDSKFNSKGVGI